MDCETVKVLILEKIFNVFAPKIIGYYSILNQNTVDCIYTWTPSQNYLDSNQKEGHSNAYRYFNISMDVYGNNLKIHFSKEQHNDNNQTRMRMALIGRMRDREGRIEPPPPPEIIQLEFTNKKIAIQEICKHTDIAYLTRIGMSAIKEIESHNNPEHMSIGSIKQILGVNPSMNLNDLETRKVLIEKLN